MFFFSFLCSSLFVRLVGLFVFFYPTKGRGRVVRSQRGDSVKRSLEASARAPRLRAYVLFFQAAFEKERRTKMCLLDKKTRAERVGQIRFLLLTLRDPE